jgi:predicted NUDIX family NTP pyrophosphohydrolase
MPTSAGILVYKKIENGFHFLLAHPGGPFYKNKDEGAWGIPKGLVEKNEDPKDAAQREFLEETSLILPKGELIELPIVKYKNGKILYSWAIEVDDLDLTHFKSNTFEMKWSTKSTELKTFEEIDQLIFFELTIAKQKIHPVQLPLIEEICNRNETK